MSNGNPPAADDAGATTQLKLVRALGAALGERQAAPVRVVETHISYVLLTGRYAYKIKKAIALGFVDYSTLALRRRYCADELRLNRRLAATIYLAVVAIHGTPAAPRIDQEDSDDGDDGSEPAIEYAVKMIEFPQSALFEQCLARGELPAAAIDALAARIADFHAQAARLPPADNLATPQRIWQSLADNADQLGRLATSTDERATLATLVHWCRKQYDELAAFFAQRRAGGYVRECHGDLHLGNIALIDGQPLVFDCIEFSVPLRWIDVIDEVAFLAMDLEQRGHPDLAWRFINAYLERSGDYAGLRCLPFYRIHRALVRAKVAALRAAQEETGVAGEQGAKCRHHLAYALRASAARRPFLLLMHGVSGAGKTRAAQALGAQLHAVRLRSDVERKRLHGLPALARSDSPADGGIYSEASDLATYQRLAQLARELLAAGLPVLIDAACLAPWQRSLLRSVADDSQLPLRIVSCRADTATLRRRVAARAAAGGDASEAGVAILAAQLNAGQALADDEQALTIVFDSVGQSYADLVQRVEASLSDA